MSSVPSNPVGMTVWLASINCTAVVDFREYRAVPLSNWNTGFPFTRSIFPSDPGASVTTDPSGNVTMVNVFPAFTSSPARTGHIGTP